MASLPHAFAGILAGALMAMPANSSRAGEVYRHLGPVEVIENGVVRLAVAPRIGRVVSFRRPDGPEWLAVNDAVRNPGWHWNPWGGDRVWPTAQMLCPQIYGNTGFDPAIDGLPWKVVGKGANFLELLSAESKELGIRIQRRIELPAGEPVAVHEFRLESVGTRRYPVHVWTVTGISAPEKILLETDPHVPHFGFKRFKWWPEYSPAVPTVEKIDSDRALAVTVADDKKIGAYGRWIAALRDGEIFLQTIRYDAKALYLEASNLQVYTEKARAIYEMETLSPTWLPGKNGTFFWTVRWELITLPKGADPQNAASGEARKRIE